MNTAWFVWLGVLLIAYAVLDGVDLGAGALHLIVARSNNERRQALNAIAPFWSGYEVYLLTAGGSMVAAFPRLYAASFSGFYIVLMLVLWLFIGRGLSLEVRSRIDDPLWQGFWDVIYFVSSTLLAIVFGAAVANVVRGVPLDATGNFQGSLTLALNPYAILVGVFSLVLLSMHGAHFLAFRTEGEVQERSRRAASFLWPVTVILMLAVTGVGFAIKPGLGSNFAHYPALLILPIIGLAGVAASKYYQSKKQDEAATVASGAIVLGLLGSAGASLYPTLLANLNGGPGLTIYNTAAPHANLVSAFALNLIGMVLVVYYQTTLHKLMRGKVELSPGATGY